MIYKSPYNLKKFKYIQDDIKIFKTNFVWKSIIYKKKKIKIKLRSFFLSSCIFGKINTFLNFLRLSNVSNLKTLINCHYFKQKKSNPQSCHVLYIYTKRLFKTALMFKYFNF